ncbi:MAG: hypothetical protein IJ530_01655 [Treponema sp.]|uniref:hypothetical protein n=1 Tax=Treponema sp. TaxID=166 RepID=UPI0025F6088C|nr:hypothetical protein [Treponema sp.]MBQ8678446.1 hypothetical protein [Treponema sp.]
MEYLVKGVEISEENLKPVLNAEYKTLIFMRLQLQLSLVISGTGTAIGATSITRNPNTFRSIIREL